MADKPSELVQSSTVTKNQKLLETDDEYFGQCLGQAEDLTNEQVAEAQEFVLRYRCVFSTRDFDLGPMDKFKHRIDLENEMPFKQRHRGIPPALYKEVHAHL